MGSFIESFHQGMNLAHMVENDKRLREVAQRQAEAHQMQMAVLARQLSTPTDYELYQKLGPKEYGEYKQAGKITGKLTPKGFAGDNRQVVQDERGNLLYKDTGKPYKGGQIKPITLPSALIMPEGEKRFVDYSDGTKNIMYETFARGGKKPTFSSRDKAGFRSFTMGYNSWLNDKGITPGNITAVRADIKANEKSLKKLTESMNVIRSFEEGAVNALRFAGEVFKDFNTGKYPRYNSVAQLVAYEMGDPKIKAVRNVIETAAVEYVKVVTAGSGISATELSQRGQERAHEMINSMQNPESLKNIVQSMVTEMKISGEKFGPRITQIQRNLNEPIGDMINRISGKGAPVPQRKPDETIAEYLKRTQG